MYNKHPTIFITDQDPAMRKAIELTFSNTVHRCCQWHVMRKARENLGPQYNLKEGWGKKLGVVINRSLSVSEFEFRWKTLIEEYKLHDNKHLKVMYNSRSQWVPAYFRDYFFADMSTTQRSESMNALFKIWVNNHTSIYQFVKQIEKMIEGIWQRESDEDLKYVNETPKVLNSLQNGGSSMSSLD
jgi:MULE transposase domain